MNEAPSWPEFVKQFHRTDSPRVVHPRHAIGPWRYDDANHAWTRQYRNAYGRKVRVSFALNDLRCHPLRSP